VGLLDVLNEPGVAVVVPDVVLAEIGAHGAADPAVVAVRAAPWIGIVPTPTLTREVADWNLGPGESAVLEVENVPPTELCTQ
jgi:hypothetical protein